MKLDGGGFGGDVLGTDLWPDSRLKVHPPEQVLEARVVAERWTVRIYSEMPQSVFNRPSLRAASRMKKE